MKLYLYMVMGGSICTLLYIILNSIFPYELSAAERKLYLKINIAFHLLPLPWFVVEIKAIVREIMDMAGVTFELSENIVRHPNSIWESEIIRDENGKIIYITGYYRWVPVILIMSIIFLTLLLVWMIAYFIVTNRYKRDVIYIEPHEYLVNGKTEKNVRIGASPYVNSPITVGMFRPVILFPINDEKYNASIRGIIRHELKHISAMDSLFRFLSFVIVAMEWYNPLSYYLLKENIAVSEIICDAAAVEGMSRDEKKNYMECIIEAVGKANGPQIFIAGLGKTRGLSKERMKRIMGKNGKGIWKKGAAIGIIVFCIGLSSFPSLAYQKPVEHWGVDSSQDMSERFDGIDDTLIVPEGNSDPYNVEIVDFSLGDKIFISEDGTIYPVEDDVFAPSQVEAACTHSYQTGTYYEHEKNSDGSCKVVQYNVKVCSKCGDIGEYVKVATIFYDICPH